MIRCRIYPATEKQEELLNSAEGPPSSNSPMPLLLVIDDYQDIQKFYTPITSG